MNRRRAAEAVAANLRTAIESANQPINTVAQAADMTTTELSNRLQGREEITLGDLVRVGGFLRIPAHELMTGVQA